MKHKVSYGTVARGGPEGESSGPSHTVDRPHQIAAHGGSRLAVLRRYGESQLRAILDAIADGIVLVDREGVIHFVNPAAERLLGRPRAELVSHPFGYPLETGRTTEIEVPREGDVASVVEMGCLEMEWGGEPAWLVSLRDITEYRKAEAAQSALQRERLARREAESALRERDEFITILNHELRTPLTRLRLWIHRARRQAETSATDMATQAVQSLHEADNETEQLSRLVAQLVEVSRLESGARELELEPLEITRIVQRQMERAMAGGQWAINLHAPSEPVIASLDRQAFEQIVGSMLDFAIRRGPPDRPIDVELTTTREEQPLFRLAVRHHGKAIPEEGRPALFGQSFAAHSSGYAAGFGIWLYVSRRLAELHQGKVEVDLPEDGGTRVTVTLPVGKVEPGEAGLSC